MKLIITYKSFLVFPYVYKIKSTNNRLFLNYIHNSLHGLASHYCALHKSLSNNHTYIIFLNQNQG